MDFILDAIGLSIIVLTLPPSGPLLCLLLFVPLAIRAVPGRWASCVSAIVVFAVGLVGTLVAMVFMAALDGPLSRLSFWQNAIGYLAFDYLGVFWIFSLAALMIWLAGEACLRRLCPRRPNLPFPRRFVLGFGLVALLLSSAAAAYLATYTTLEDAVRTGDVELARKRLHFNLLGVGVRDGDTMRYSGGVNTEPLLPLAVSLDDVKMAAFLLKHGADVNQAPSSLSEFAQSWGTRGAGLEMVKLLADAGMDPSILRRPAARLLSELDAEADPETVEFLRALCFPSRR